MKAEEIYTTRREDYEESLPLPAKERRLYTATEAARAAGVPPDTVYHWAIDGILRPQEKMIRGHKAGVYTADQVVTLAILGEAKKLFDGRTKVYRQIVKLAGGERCQRAIPAGEVTDMSRRGELANVVLAVHSKGLDDLVYERLRKSDPGHAVRLNKMRKAKAGRARRG